MTSPLGLGSRISELAAEFRQGSRSGNYLMYCVVPEVLTSWELVAPHRDGLLLHIQDGRHNHSSGAKCWHGCVYIHNKVRHELSLQTKRTTDWGGGGVRGKIKTPTIRLLGETNSGACGNQTQKTDKPNCCPTRHLQIVEVSSV